MAETANSMHFSNLFEHRAFLTPQEKARNRGLSGFLTTSKLPLLRLHTHTGVHANGLAVNIVVLNDVRRQGSDL